MLERKDDTAARGAAAAAAPDKRAALDPAQTLKLAREVFEIEAQAVQHVAARLDARFVQAVSMILACRGRVVVSGIGKSGHIARKIAATLASTGTPAFFVHPAEARHGDLGMIRGEDVMLALSYSGESEELADIVPLVKRQGAGLIVLSGSETSSLASHADVLLDTRVEREACPMNLSPTASTTAALAMGDALAVALLDARGFDREDFARSHPGGALGRRLLTLVADVMRTGSAVPAVSERASLSDAVLEMSRKGMGMTAIVDDAGRLLGIFTDGDLRRTFEGRIDVRSAKVSELMTRSPRTVGAQQLAVEAVQVMDTHRVNQLLVVEPDGRLAGALNTHDLLRSKVI